MKRVVLNRYDVVNRYNKLPLNLINKSMLKAQALVKFNAAEVVYIEDGNQKSIMKYVPNKNNS